MRYDVESGNILITVKELVALARRGISQTLPCDEDEPRRNESGGRARKTLLGDIGTRELRYTFKSGDFSFELYGTPDGAEDGKIILLRSSYGKARREEVAQSRAEGYIYGYMLKRLTGGENPKIRNIYHNSKEESFETKEECPSEKKLSEFFEKCVKALTVFGKPEVERVTERLPSLKKIKFPYESVREGQGEFIRAVYKVLAQGRTLYASAPTGTGKTVSVLYPALSGLGNGKYEKIFYLTPKSTTKAAAEACLSAFAEGGAKIRAISLTSKDRVCRNRRICKDDRSLCPNAKCNNLPQAVLALYSLQKTVVGEEDVDAIAPSFSVCPHELELAYSELCDVVICDFNYVFDPSAYIRRYFEEGGRYALLIDESHNLIDRAREMYSSELTLDELLEVEESPVLNEFSPFKKRISELRLALNELLLPYLKEEIRENDKGRKLAGISLSDVPGDMYSLIDELHDTLEREALLCKRSDAPGDREKKNLLNGLLHKVRKVNNALQIFDEKFRLFLFYEDGNIKIKLFCLDTGGVISHALTKVYGAVFFSATLSPLNYYKNLLGAEGSSSTLEVASPFVPEQLCVSIIDKISTRYSERARTLPAVCRAVAATLSARRGNYMVFSPSFEYSEALAKAFAEKYPKINVLVQRGDMSAKEKEDFLAKFKEPDGKYLVGFCVMGGLYSEGVDLAGDSLIGAIVVGIGMPTLSFEREAMAEYFEDRYEEGKQYAYVYPGMNRVFQAAGRVIRRDEDRGVIVLIDDRFADPIYKKSIPSLWRGMRYVSDAKELKERIEKFWRSVDGELK